MFPSSLLSRLFVHGSLRNTADGAEFHLKNVIESGTITGWNALIINDETIDPSTVNIAIRDMQITADQISFSRPVYARTLADIAVSIKDFSLPEGEHKIFIALNTAEAGKIQFTVTEPLSADSSDL